MAIIKQAVSDLAKLSRAEIPEELRRLGQRTDRLRLNRFSGAIML